jgi:glycosyltransferase involved in cell wall biosynthesis
VLVGDFGDVFHTHVPELRAAVERWGLADRVRFTGFVPDDQLAFIYSRAYALVHPSLMEGFGLPPVEAMACGTPVVSSNAGSLPEVIGEAGVFFEPTDVSAIAAALQGLGNDPKRRDELAKIALNRAAYLNWDSAAQALLACFEELSSTLSRPATPRKKTA